MDLETHAHEMRLLFGDGYGNVASTIAEQFSSGGIAERLLAALENQHEVASLRAQLAAVTAQRDELLAAIAKWQRLEDASEEAWECWWEGMKASGGAEPEPELAAAYKASLVQVRLAQNEVRRIARAQPEQPQQPKEEP